MRSETDRLVAELVEVLLGERPAGAAPPPPPPWVPRPAGPRPEPLEAWARRHGLA